uniref:Ribonucleoside-diphosphate reductase n=1 Tax=Megaviridae environmental sample TaxID=1737588 RepID=A0A5J6VLG7_9VIRU|nr:MAG: ribonucleotide reductase, barrel domain [Megaviridae environmental sample]
MINNNITMFVVKRDGEEQIVKFDKITSRLDKLITKNEKQFIDTTLIAQKVIQSIYPGITTEELDLESANICMNMVTTHHMYHNIAGKILISNLQKKSGDNFVDKMNLIQKNVSNENPFLNEEWLLWLNQNKEAINNMIDYKRDYTFDFFGFKTLERAYLIKNKHTGEIYERPQDMFLRIASFIHKGDLAETKKTYDMLSCKNYIHGSPTVFNSGLTRSQLSSCFLIGTEDSLEGITQTWDRVSKISKWGGGVGLHVSNIRAKGSLIGGTNGPSSGIVPMIQVYNWISRYFNQGGKRKGSFAMYLETHHADIFDFIDLKKNHGAEDQRARDIFLALWVSDLFMEQVEKNSDWYLFCPHEAPGLTDVYGEEYNKLYWKYVEEKRYKKKISANKLMLKIIESQIETGMPYMLYKDSINRKSNQKNIGVIKSSNLCAEIVEVSDSKEHAVCNLGSIALNSCIVPFKSKFKWTIYTIPNCNFCKWAKNFMEYNKFNFDIVSYDEKDHREKLCEHTDVLTFPQIYYKNEHIGGFNDMIKFTSATYNFKKLWKIAHDATINLDKIIDINYYPTKEGELSNKKHRPIGLGIQGLADTLVQMRINFDSNEACGFNARMMETIYHAALSASMELAKAHGPYSTFEGSPISKGIFQFDMWDHKPKYYDWSLLKKNISTHGVRNSLLTALMPTASTSQLLGNNECFEWFTSNIYTRRVLAGDFPIVNKHLVNDLYAIGEWNEDTKQLIVADNGSVGNIHNIPNIYKDLYKTIWEIKQIWVLKNAKARAPFVDQTQSMNIFMAVPNNQKLYSCHNWGWKNGLKTGMYYLRSKPANSAIKVTIDPTIRQRLNDECESCSG